MSLVCHECEIDVQPSDVLPGREGGFLSANVLARVWAPGQEGQPDEWVEVSIEARGHCALCFECIAKKLPHDRQGAMSAVFAAYDAETAYRRTELGHQRKWIGEKELGKLDRSHKALVAKWRDVPMDSCFFCKAALPGSGRDGFFTLRAFDKAAAENSPSGWGSYQWSVTKAGMTGFKICFGCFRPNFPRIAGELSYMLRGVDETNTTKKSELWVSPEFLRELPSNPRAH